MKVTQVVTVNHEMNFKVGEKQVKSINVKGPEIVILYSNGLKKIIRDYPYIAFIEPIKPKPKAKKK